jgi:hypothetical protein
MERDTNTQTDTSMYANRENSVSDHVVAMVSDTELKIERTLLLLSENERDAISALLVSKHRQRYKTVEKIVQMYGVRDSFEVARVATTRAGYGDVLGIFSESLRKDRKLVSMAVQQDGDALEYASKQLRDNEQVVMRALRSDTHSCNEFAPLKHVSERLRSIRHVVKAGVEQDGNAIQFASKALQGDAELVTTALGRYKHPHGFVSDCMVIKYVSDHLRTDRCFAIQVVKQNGHLLYQLPKEVRADREVAMAAAVALQLPRDSSSSLSSYHHHTMEGLVGHGRSI